MDVEETSHSSKRVAVNTLLLYGRMIVLILLGLLTSRITLQALGVENYGIFSVVGGIVTILGFLNNSMAGATQRYINVALGEKDQQKLNNIVSNALILHFGIAIICLILAETLGLWFLNECMDIPEGRMGAANWVYQFSVITFMMSILTVPYMASIIAHEKMSAFAWITIFDVVMKLLIVIMLLYVDVDKLILLAILSCVAANVTRLIYIRYCKKHFDECTVKSWKIDKPLMKSMSSFSSWTIFGSLGYLTHTQGIAIVINLFFGVTVNAAQGIANQVNNYVSQFVSNFLMAFNPQVVKTYASGEIAEMHKLVLRGSRVALLLMGVIVMPLIIEMPNILYLWLGQVPDYSVIFVRLILLITFLNSYSGLMASAQGATGKIKTYQIALTIIGFLHLPLAWIFFELGFEPYWGQIIYLLIIIILQIVRTSFVCNAIGMLQKTFYLDSVIRGLGSVAIAVIIPVIIHIYFPNSFVRTIIVCTLSVILTCSTSFFIGITKEERVVVLSKIREISNKFLFKK